MRGRLWEQCPPRTQPAPAAHQLQLFWLASEGGKQSCVQRALDGPAGQPRRTATRAGQCVEERLGKGACGSHTASCGAEAAL